MSSDKPHSTSGTPSLAMLATPTPEHATLPRVVIIGAGPAGLAAAERIAAGGGTRGVRIDVYDAMPSVGRKFLRAGIGGLNITHSEPYDLFRTRFGRRPPVLQTALDTFPPDALRAWAEALGVKTFIGTSGRVFPAEMKAAPLLRAWLQQLRTAGVTFHTRHRWLGWSDADRTTSGAPVPTSPRPGGPIPLLRFASPAGVITQRADAVVLALGGGSWPQLGSDGAWVPWLEAQHIPVAPLRSANGGFSIHWSTHLRDRFAGSPLKSVALSFTDLAGETLRRQGEFVISTRGVEGSLIYAFSHALRETIEAHGSATFTLDLLPDRAAPSVAEAVAHPRGSRSLSSHLQSRLGLTGIKTALLYEVLDKQSMQDPATLAQAIKALPLTVLATMPLAEAISSAGGVMFSAVDDHLMVRNLPGVFVAGEMLDWEAPTGGYLLTACLATGRHAGQGLTRYLRGGSA